MAMVIHVVLHKTENMASFHSSVSGIVMTARGFVREYFDFINVQIGLDVCIFEAQVWEVSWPLIMYMIEMC